MLTICYNSYLFTYLIVVFLQLIIVINLNFCSNTQIENLESSLINNNTYEEDQEESELVASTMQQINKRVENLNLELDVHLGWRYLKALLNAAKIVEDEHQQRVLILAAVFYAEATVSETSLTLDIYEFLKTDLANRVKVLKPLKLRFSKDALESNDDNAKKLEQNLFTKLKVDFVVAQLEANLRLSTIEHFDECIARTVSQCAYALHNSKREMHKELRNFLEFFSRRVANERKRCEKAEAKMVKMLRLIVSKVMNPSKVKQLLLTLRTPKFLEDNYRKRHTSRPLAESENAFEQVYTAYIMQIYSEFPEYKKFNDEEYQISADNYLKSVQIDDNESLLEPLDMFTASLTDDSQTELLKRAAKQASLKHKSFNAEIVSYFNQIPDLEEKLITIIKQRELYYKRDIEDYKVFLSDASRAKSELARNFPSSLKCANAIQELLDTHSSFWHHKFNLHERVKSFAFDTLMINYNEKLNIDASNSLLDYKNNHARLLLNIPNNDRTFVLSNSEFLNLFGMDLAYRQSYSFVTKISENKHKQKLRDASSICNKFQNVLILLKVVGIQHEILRFELQLNKAKAEAKLDKVKADACRQQSYVCMMNKQSIAFLLSGLFGFVQGSSMQHFDFTRSAILAGTNAGRIFNFNTNGV